MLNTLSVDNFPIPGDAGFLLNAHYAPPGSRVDGGMLSQVVQSEHHLTCRQITCDSTLFRSDRNLLHGWWRDYMRMELENRANGGCHSRRGVS